MESDMIDIALAGIIGATLISLGSFVFAALIWDEGGPLGVIVALFLSFCSLCAITDFVRCGT